MLWSDLFAIFLFNFIFNLLKFAILIEFYIICTVLTMGTDWFLCSKDLNLYILKYISKIKFIFSYNLISLLSMLKILFLSFLQDEVPKEY
jgi:hypothetical protein